MSEELHIYPSLAARDAAVAVEAGDCVRLDLHLTFEALFAALAPPPGRRWASPLACRLLVRGLLAEAGGVLQPLAGDAHAVRAATEALAELRLAGLTAKHFAKLGVSAELAELVQLLSRYEQLLASEQLYDAAESQRWAVHAVIERRLPPQLAGVGSVEVHGVGDLFGARLDLLSAFASRGCAVTVTLPHDDARPSAFGWPDASLHQIESRGRDHVTLRFDDRVGHGPLAELRAAQFSDAVVPGAPIDVVQAASTAEHARSVAALAAGWLRQGLPPDALYIATPDVDGLGNAVALELSRLGIPSYGRRGARLSTSQSARALCTALRAAAAGMPRETIAELVQSLSFSAGPWSPNRLVRELRRAGVRSTRVGGYRAPLVDLAQRKDRRGDGTTVAEANAAAAALEQLFQELEAVPPRGDPASLVEAAHGLLGRLGVVPRAVAGPSGELDDFGGRRLLAAQVRQHAAAAELDELLHDLWHAARSVPASMAQRWPLGREELAAWIEVSAAERRLPPSGLRAGAVGIGRLEDLVGARYRRVILAGIDAGTFPRTPPADLLLTEELRAEVNKALGPRLLQHGATTGRGALPGYARDTWLWLEALASAEQRLAVTYTLNEGTDHEGTSEVIDELLRSLGKRVVEPALPSYALEQPAGPAQAIERWAFAHLAFGARVAPLGDRERAAALGAALRRVSEERLWRLEHRVAVERAITGEARSFRRLGGGDRERLAAYFYESTHSPSRLDALGICAFRHFAQAVLGLEREEVPTLGADAREQGSIAHAALHLVYEDLVGRGGLAQARLDVPGAFDRARRLFDQNHARLLAEARVHPLLVGAALEDAWRAVVAQLEHDLGAEDGFEPVAVEYRFDADPRADGPLLVIESEDGRSLKVRGSIDRIDASSAALRVIDYKRTLPDREPGRALQLPVYLAAAVAQLGEGKTTLLSAFSELRTAKQQLVPMPEERDAFRAELARDLFARVDRVLAGDVSPDASPELVCKSCDFRPLCRKDAVRSEAKS